MIKSQHWITHLGRGIFTLSILSGMTFGCSDPKESPANPSPQTSATQLEAPNYDLNEEKRSLQKTSKVTAKPTLKEKPTETAKALKNTPPHKLALPPPALPKNGITPPVVTMVPDRLPANIPTLEVPQTPQDPFVLPQGVPRNTRRIPEGYWIGSRPITPQQIEVLADSGVKVILSGVALKRKVRKKIEELELAHVSVPFGQSFPSSKKILNGLKDFKSSEIFIHCEHGGDRSGAMLAFLLVLREKWRPDHALLAMTFPKKQDIQGQVKMLKGAGLHVTDEELSTYLGIYSGDRNGGYGGLKVRNAGYRRLVATTLKAMAARGVSLIESEATGDMAMAGRPEDVLEMP